MTEDVFRAVVAALDRGEEAALVTIVSTRGSTPQRVGAKMLVFADGRTIGTIGGGCYEHDACGRARAVLGTGRPELVRYELSDDVAAETGLICGGQMEVYIEPVETRPHLFIVGAGHVGYHLARIAADLGFRLHVLDDREKYASRERFPEADEVVADSVPEWLSRQALPPGAYVVIATRGHRYDLDALKALAGRELRYVGMIGSRAKVHRVMDALAADGVPVEWLQRVRAPIGLDIGAVTPAEIAVSICAELVATRYRGRAAGHEGAPLSLQWAPRARGAAPDAV
jgi:xanthine dehydrogenase accessory factor